MRAKKGQKELHSSFKATLLSRHVIIFLFVTKILLDLKSMSPYPLLLCNQVQVNSSQNLVP